MVTAHKHNFTILTLYTTKSALLLRQDIEEKTSKTKFYKLPAAKVSLAVVQLFPKKIHAKELKITCVFVTPTGAR